MSMLHRGNRTPTSEADVTADKITTERMVEIANIIDAQPCLSHGVWDADNGRFIEVPADRPAPRVAVVKRRTSKRKRP